MGTPVRNASSAISHSKTAALMAAEAAASPPFVIEWRQTRSPDVVISPADVGNKKVLRQVRGTVGAVKSSQRASSGPVETPHHVAVSSSKTINTPDDLEEQVPAKKLKPVRRLESLQELKSVVRRRQQQPVVLSPVVESSAAPSAAINLRFAATTSNDSLNDDSYNQLLSQIVDSVANPSDERQPPSAHYNPFCSPIQKPYQSQSRQSLPGCINSPTSTPLRRSIRNANKPTPSRVHVQVVTEEENQRSKQPILSKSAAPVSSHNISKAPPHSVINIDDDDDDCDLLLLALEQAEESSNSRDGPQPLAGAENSSQPKSANKRQFQFVAVQPKPLLPVNKQPVPAVRPVSPVKKQDSGGIGQQVLVADSKNGLTLSEKAKIEAKRMAALSKLQMRNQPTFAAPQPPVTFQNNSSTTSRAFLPRPPSVPTMKSSQQPNNGYAGPNCTNNRFPPPGPTYRAQSVTGAPSSIRPSFGASNQKR